MKKNTKTFVWIVSIAGVVLGLYLLNKWLYNKPINNTSEPKVIK